MTDREQDEPQKEWQLWGRGPIGEPYRIDVEPTYEQLASEAKRRTEQSTDGFVYWVQPVASEDETFPSDMSPADETG